MTPLDRAVLAERTAAVERHLRFRNVVAHMYEELDMRRVHEAASQGPEDLRAFLRIVRDLT